MHPDSNLGSAAKLRAKVLFGLTNFGSGSVTEHRGRVLLVVVAAAVGVESDASAGGGEP